MEQRSESAVRVLLVEDDRLSRVLVEEALSDLGVHLTTAASLGDAMLLLSSALDFDVLLLDWRLDGRPAQSILDLAALLGPSRRPRVILVTGSILPEEITSLVPTQIDRVLMKPINLSELIEVVLGSRRRGAGRGRDTHLTA